MKYRIALPAVAATAVLALAPAMASAAQRPVPHGSITYSRSCYRNVCSATVDESTPAFSRSVARPQTFEFITIDQRRARYTASLSVSAGGRHHYGPVYGAGWSREARGTEIYRVTIPELGPGSEYTLTIATVTDRGQVPVVVEGQPAR